MTAQYNVPIPDDLAKLLDGSTMMATVAKAFAVERDLLTPAMAVWMERLHKDAVDALQAFVDMPDPGADPRGVRAIHHKLRGALGFAAEMVGVLTDGHIAEMEAVAEDQLQNADADIDDRGGSVRDPAPQTATPD